MIEKLLTKSESNLHNVESQINFTFLRLSAALDNRRKDLIDEAQTIYKRKVKSLTETKKKCLKGRRSISRQSSIE